MGGWGVNVSPKMQCRPHSSTTSANLQLRRTGCVCVWVVGVGDNNRNNENNNKSQPTFVYRTQFVILPYYTTLALLRSTTLSLPVALSLSLFVCSLHLVAPALFCTHWAAPLSLTFFGCSFSLIFVSRRIHKNSLKAAHDAASTLSLTSTAL